MLRKKTLLSEISQELVDRGFYPLFVPEAATTMIKGNILPGQSESEFDFQRGIVERQIFEEAFFERFAHLHERPVLFCDRGILDGAAYLSGDVSLESFQKNVLKRMLGKSELSVEGAWSRYDGVVHLVTAANGAEEFYTLANNKARKETPGEAIILDHRTQEAWTGHPHLRVVSNTDKGNQITFKEKKDRAIKAILEILGAPVPVEDEQKYLLDGFDPDSIPVPYRKIDIVQTYLQTTTPAAEERVRQRSWGGGFSFYHTVKTPIPGVSSSKRRESEKMIGLKDYLEYLQKAEPGRIPLLKDRYCFLYKDQYFEVDVLKERHTGKEYLEREKTSANTSNELPPFLNIKEEVTGNPEHKMSHLALV